MPHANFELSILKITLHSTFRNSQIIKLEKKFNTYTSDGTCKKLTDTQEKWGEEVTITFSYVICCAKTLT